jgi:hypothetical protein
MPKYKIVSSTNADITKMSKLTKQRTLFKKPITIKGGSAKASKGGSTKASKGGSTKASKGGSTKASKGGSAKASKGGSAKASKGGSTKASKGGSTKASKGGSAKASKGGSAKASKGGSAKASKGGSAKANKGGSAKASKGGSAKEDVTSVINFTKVNNLNCYKLLLDQHKKTLELNPVRQFNKLNNKILKWTNLQKTHSLFLYDTGEEAQLNIIHASTTSYNVISKQKPHIIISRIENKKVMQYIQNLRDNGTITISIVSPNIYGVILVNDVKKLIKADTCLIVVSYSDSQIGSLSDITSINTMARSHKIPVMSNCSSMFMSKEVTSSIMFLNLSEIGCVSIGICLIDNEFLSGYELHKYSDKFNSTPNAIQTSMALTVFENYLKQKTKKIKHINKIQDLLYEKLEKEFHLVNYTDYMLNGNTISGLSIVFIGLNDNTLKMTGKLSFILFKNTHPIPNVYDKLKKMKIETTKSINVNGLNYILNAIKIPKNASSSVIHININDFNSVSDVSTLSSVLSKLG